MEPRARMAVGMLRRLIVPYDSAAWEGPVFIP